MSKVKRYIENEIAALASITGYSCDFLMDIWSEECAEGDADFEYFRGVTLERDW